MTAIHVTPIYAALLGLLFVALTVRVIRARRAAKVAIGVTGHATLERLARVQGNFAEHVPLALVMLLLAEMTATPAWILHGLGLGLTIGRLAHAIGVSRTPEDFRFRIVGVTTTLGVIVLLAIILLWRTIIATI